METICEVEVLDTTRFDMYDGADVWGFADREGWEITLTYNDGHEIAWVGHNSDAFEAAYRYACDVAEGA